MSGVSKALLSTKTSRSARQRQGKQAVFLWLCLVSVLLVGCGGRAAIPTSDQPFKPVVVSEEASRRAVEHVMAALDEPGPFRLTLTDEELTSYLATDAPNDTIDDVAIWLTPNQVHLAGQLRAWGQHRIQAVLTLIPYEGTLRVGIQRGLLDGRPLPRFLLASLEKAINDALADAASPVEIDQVLVSEGSVLIVGTRN
jgi:hypothetical protein